MTEFTDDDVGKRVVNSHGDTIGLVSGVQSGTAYIDPDPGLTDKIRSRLGWDSVGESDYALDSDHVETVTDEEIRLNR